MSLTRLFQSSSLILTLLLAQFSILQAQDPVPEEPAGEDVVALVNASDEHTVFSDLIEEAQFTETLQQQGPYTILAPTDEAFEQLNLDLDQIRQDPQQLQNMMVNHLFQGEATASEVESSFGVEIEEGDMEADNGLVHSLKEVLLER